LVEIVGLDFLADQVGQVDISEFAHHWFVEFVLVVAVE